MPEQPSTNFKDPLDEFKRSLVATSGSLDEGYTELANIFVPKTKFAGRENNEASCRLAVREDYLSEGVVDRVYRFTYMDSYCCDQHQCIAISDTLQQEGSFQVEALLAAVVDYISHREDNQSSVALHLLRSAQEILTVQETIDEATHG